MAKKMTLPEFLEMVKKEYDALPDSEAENYRGMSNKIGNGYSDTITKYLSRETIMASSEWVNRSREVEPYFDLSGESSSGETNPHAITSGGFAYSTTVVGVTPDVIFRALLKQYQKMDADVAKTFKEYKIHSYGLEASTHYDYDDASSKVALAIHFSTPATYDEALQQARAKLYEVQRGWREAALKRLAAISVAERNAAQKAKEDADARKAEEKKQKEFDRLLKKLPKETLEALLAAKQ